MSEELSKEDAKLKRKLERIDNTDLKELVEEAKKIREEIGDNPEIKNIEYDIVHAQSNARTETFINGVKLLFGMACVGVAFFSYNGVNSDLSGNLSNIILGLVGLGIASNNQMNLITDYNLSISKSLIEIKSKIEKLKLIDENKNLKQQLKEAGLIEMEQTENLEGEEHAKRR